MEQLWFSITNVSNNDHFLIDTVLNEKQLLFIYNNEWIESGFDKTLSSSLFIIVTTFSVFSSNDNLFEVSKLIVALLSNEEFDCFDVSYVWEDSSFLFNLLLVLLIPLINLEVDFFRFDLVSHSFI